MTGRVVYTSTYLANHHIRTTWSDLCRFAKSPQAPQIGLSSTKGTIMAKIHDILMNPDKRVLKARTGIIMDNADMMREDIGNMTKEDVLLAIQQIESMALKLRIMLNRGELDKLVKRSIPANPHVCARCTTKAA